MQQKSESESRASDYPVESLIRTIRGQKVILDVDLASVYGVSTKRLNEQVRRNLNRFPDDFLFQLTEEEIVALNWSQNAANSPKRRGRPYLPFAFTEHEAIMAATILNSPHADQMSVFVVRAFVKMRSLLSDQKDLARKLVELERQLTGRLDIHPAAGPSPLARDGQGSVPRRATKRPWSFMRRP